MNNDPDYIAVKYVDGTTEDVDVVDWDIAYDDTHGNVTHIHGKEIEFAYDPRCEEHYGTWFGPIA